VEAEYRGLQLRTTDEDPEHQGYFEHARKGTLAVQLCEGCGRMRASFNCACPFCQSGNWHWQPLSGRGTIYSWSVVTQAVHPAFRDWTPYPLVLVELEEQRAIPWWDGVEGETVSLRVIANLVSPEDSSVPEKEENIAIGTEVEVCFVPLSEDAALPQFRIARSASRAKARGALTEEA
jgi:uncharacterized protein